jgi:hypothetical protein
MYLTIFASSGRHRRSAIADWAARPTRPARRCSSTRWRRPGDPPAAVGGAGRGGPEDRSALDGAVQGAERAVADAARVGARPGGFGQDNAHGGEGAAPGGGGDARAAHLLKPPARGSPEGGAGGRGARGGVRLPRAVQAHVGGSGHPTEGNVERRAGVLRGAPAERAGGCGVAAGAALRRDHLRRGGGLRLVVVAAAPHAARGSGRGHLLRLQRRQPGDLPAARRAAREPPGVPGHLPTILASS